MAIKIQGTTIIPDGAHCNVAVGTGANQQYNTLVGNTPAGIVAIGNCAHANGTGGSGQNIAIGDSTLCAGTYPYNSVAVGHNALKNSNGAANIGIGTCALHNNTTGTCNLAIGFEALKVSTTASWNVAIGPQSMISNTTGYQNTALGGGNLKDNTTGYRNVGMGYATLCYNISGYENTGIGWAALGNNTSGAFNTALGSQALNANAIASYNTAVGACALPSGNNNATLNTAIGYQTGRYVSGASCNTIIGTCAGQNIEDNVNVTVLGYRAEPSSYNSTNEVTIGNSSVTCVRLANGAANVAHGIFWENGKTVTTNYTITSNKNAMSAGPITVNTGITVTVPSGSTWTIV